VAQAARVAQRRFAGYRSRSADILDWRSRPEAQGHKFGNTALIKNLNLSDAQTRAGNKGQHARVSAQGADAAAMMNQSMFTGAQLLRALRRGVLKRTGSSFKFILGVLPEKARLDTAGAIKVNLRETCIRETCVLKCAGPRGAPQEDREGEEAGR
jgi:hypothetical protein